MPINPDEELRLYTTPAERELYDSLATLFSIVVSLEYLERAYVRDSISAKEYTPACTRLLSQYKGILKLVPEREFPSLEAFMERFRMDNPAAVHRLKLGVPATVEHSSGDNNGGETGKSVAEVTQSFITLLDALKLNMRAKDQLHPYLSDLMAGYSRFKASAEWEGRGRILHWLITLNALSASDEITDEQSRQMLFDIEQAYNEFFRSLSSGPSTSGD
ncbi:Vacuolar sorting protein VPS28 [Phaffia rhodozyma]|uniref:Vacuolar protein sorting-associated protein 28 n=1 Tax=Phaffia rhodozyma TaxID=264483 RepID=A0A0F7SI03_PHARH|nr:Vacuolar sorting protein VPS28 [Phaffia rhodozyma]